jgi:hypothetical protein
VSDGNEEDRYLLRRAGLDAEGSFNILLFSLGAGYGYLDPYNWPGAPMVRTFQVAHEYLEKHFDELETGTVIDVEFIVGETKEPKLSERITAREW